MNINDLIKDLHFYNEDEIIYKKYYEAKQDSVLYTSFIENINKDYIANHNLIIPEFSDKEIPNQMAEEMAVDEAK